MRLVSLDIRAKLAGLAFALVVAVVTALTLRFSADQAAAAESALEAKALTYAQLFARESEEAIAFDDIQTTREEFGAGSLDADVAAITLYRSNGVVLGAIGERAIPWEAVREPTIRRTPALIGVITPVVSKEGPRGVLVIELGLARITKQEARSRQSALMSGLVAAALGLGASWLIGNSFARRVRRIQRATQAVAEGHLGEPPIHDQSNDEIGQLSGAFNVMTEHIRQLVQRIEADGREEAARLDRIVVERTLELRKRNEDLAFVLDNVGQGFVTVDRAGRLATERSGILSTWFGAHAADAPLWDYVSAEDPEAAQWLVVGWDALFDGSLPLELVLDQLPKQVRRGDATFGLRYQPVGDESSIDAVIVVVSDVSDEIARRKAETKQRELADVVARLVSDPASVAQFAVEGAALVCSIRDGATAQAPSVELQRSIHTLKGNSAFLGLERIASTCHEMETQIAELGDAPSARLVMSLNQLWLEFTSVVEPLVFGRRDRTLVSTSALQRLIDDLRAGRPQQQLARDVQSWLLEPVAARLERAAAQAATVARRLEKPELNITIEDNDLALDAETWGTFWTSFVHVVRNAVDHGIESPEARVAAGKPASGALTLRSYRREDEVVIEVADDGAGIAWETLRKASGASATATEGELIDLLFTDGLSTRHEVSETSGRGIGLGAARAACQAMGGQVEVRTESGLGTTFSFLFPDQLQRGIAPIAA